MSEERTQQLERTFSVPARLKIMSVLVSRAEADFTELISLLELTRGNLSMHMKLLNEQGYVEIVKAFAGNKPRTTYRVTIQGRNDFLHYVKMLEEILHMSKSQQ